MRKIRNVKEISLSNVLSGTYVNKNHEWKKLKPEDADELFRLFRNYVAGTARGNRRQRIFRTEKWMLRNYGIFQRLIYDFESEKVKYICGQEWYSEMATLRDCFD